MFPISPCSVLEEFVHLLYLGCPFYWCIVAWSPVMGAAAFLPCWLIVLRCPSTEPTEVSGGDRSWWENGDLQKGSCRWELPRTTAARVFAPQGALDAPRFLRSPFSTSRRVWSGLLRGHGLFSWVPVYTGPGIQPPRAEFLLSPVLWDH